MRSIASPWKRDTQPLRSSDSTNRHAPACSLKKSTPRGNGTPRRFEAARLCLCVARGRHGKLGSEWLNLEPGVGESSLMALLYLRSRASLARVVGRFGDCRGYLYFYGLASRLLTVGRIHPAPPSVRRPARS